MNNPKPPKPTADADRDWLHPVGSASFEIYYQGEIGAGLRSFSDEVSITCKSGQWGGEPGEFEEYMRDCLKEWYDGATVTPNARTERPAIPGAQQPETL